MDFKKKIKEKGLKQRWIADQIGISPQMLSMFLNNDRSIPEEKEKMLKGLLL